MTLKEHFQKERGRCASIARRLGESPAYLSQMAAGLRPVPPALVPALVVACGGEIRHWHLRPDDWHRIWPELIGTDGAPDVPQPAAQEAA